MSNSNESMKTINFNVLKKNRKYFAATKNGYKCKIAIDSNSENLELGEQELLVNNISIRTKYGTDLIYKLAADTAEQEAAGITTLQHDRYNHMLHKSCKELGGKWDGESGAWVFSSIVEDKVEELDALYNSKLIPVQVTALEDNYKDKDAMYLLRYKLAQASGRDSGATLADGISVIEGKFTSGGSRANWDTRCSEGTVFRMMIPAALIETMTETESREWKIERI